MLCLRGILNALVFLVCWEVQGATIAPTLGYRQSGNPPYSLPSVPPNLDASRAAAIAATQAGFQYGKPVAGGPFYPAGPIGNETAARDLASFSVESVRERDLSQKDSALAVQAMKAKVKDGLPTLEDYKLLYDKQLKNILPKGPTAGILSNYTQDLLFSMERLSASPYAVRRLIPSRDSLAFMVDEAAAKAVSGSTLDELFKAGRLFYIDHSAQRHVERNSSTPTYVAACDAYFFLDKKTGNFLPLAIRTGVGANLIYTPQDQANDWLLAKIMFNANDFFFTQFNHLAATHEVVQIVWMAAIRSLSSTHPVYGILDRLMYQVFAIQPMALEVLFNPGQAVDQAFGYTGAAAQQFTDELYNGGKGRFQANFFLTDLKNRGLIDSTVGPELKNFPFYEDALVIYNAIHAFMTSFVDSYYRSDKAVLADVELQSWATEANGNAKVHDFPHKIESKHVLVDMLTHMAHLGTTAHHAVNTNELLSITAILPFHPLALYKPPPTTKGTASVASFLPGPEKCGLQLRVSGLFGRSQLMGTHRTLSHLFDDAELLARMNDATSKAAAKFKSTMEDLSDKISARKFDSHGLSQGMPFVWQALDPNVMPFSVSI